MTAAKIIDVFAKLPDCERQAADAVSAYTQVKMEDASRIAQNPKVRMSTCEYAFQDTSGRNHGPVWKILLFLLKGI